MTMAMTMAITIDIAMAMAMAMAMATCPWAWRRQAQVTAKAQPRLDISWIGRFIDSHQRNILQSGRGHQDDGQCFDRFFAKKKLYFGPISAPSCPLLALPASLPTAFSIPKPDRTRSPKIFDRLRPNFRKKIALGQFLGQFPVQFTP